MCDYIIEQLKEFKFIKLNDIDYISNTYDFDFYIHFEDINSNSSNLKFIIDEDLTDKKIKKLTEEEECTYIYKYIHKFITFPCYGEKHLYINNDVNFDTLDNESIEELINCLNNYIFDCDKSIFVLKKCFEVKRGTKINYHLNLIALKFAEFTFFNNNKDERYNTIKEIRISESHSVIKIPL